MASVFPRYCAWSQPTLEFSLWNFLMRMRKIQYGGGQLVQPQWGHFTDCDASQCDT